MNEARNGLNRAHVVVQAVLFLVAIALTLIPGAATAQARPGRYEVGWHWFRECAGGDSLILEVIVDGTSVYTTGFPICQARRSEIKPEPQQRLLQFRFDAVPRRFRRANPETGPERIEGTIWEVGGERNAILLGVSFATVQQVLLNTRHDARVDAASRTERVRGVVIVTRPVRRAGRMPPGKRVK